MPLATKADPLACCCKFVRQDYCDECCLAQKDSVLLADGICLWSSAAISAILRFQSRLGTSKASKQKDECPHPVPSD